MVLEGLRAMREAIELRLRLKDDLAGMLLTTSNSSPKAAALPTPATPRRSLDALLATAVSKSAPGQPGMWAAEPEAVQAVQDQPSSNVGCGFAG